MQLCNAGFDGSVCVWDVSLNANNEPHLLHTWHAHPDTEILTMVHDAMKNAIITAGNDCLIKVVHLPLILATFAWLLL